MRHLEQGPRTDHDGRRVAPVLDYSEALGRVKGPLAALAAGALDPPGALPCLAIAGAKQMVEPSPTLSGVDASAYRFSRVPSPCRAFPAESNTHVTPRAGLLLG